ncbi:MAG: methionyl-tRNA formyltransferase [Acidimicrobiia bacterium]|nr:methionyl-tRNA formyltransferase [Acidimicrobiia bacterium]
MSQRTLRTVFLGTPETAVPTLRALNAISEVALVVTRPDRPRGRSGTPAPPPVKVAARELGLAVAQPANHRELVDTLNTVAPVDVGVVTAFGMLLPPEALATPARGIVNVHFSLLPRWRGASPVVAAISAGDPKTGVSLMQMDEGLDTGPVIATSSTPIRPDETGQELSGRLARLGAELLSQHLADYVDGNIEPVSQSTSAATYAPQIKPADRILDINLQPQVAVNKIRALADKPGAILAIDGRAHLILAARPLNRTLPTGQIIIEDGEVLVGTGGGALMLLMIQPPGRRPMAAAAWARGLRVLPHRVG